jgi:NADP-dependent 3-hydroxy acid dehydrogenase YdfG
VADAAQVAALPLSLPPEWREVDVLINNAGGASLTADDIAEAAAWVIGLPPHMNVNLMEIMPVCQAPGPLAIKRS